MPAVLRLAYALGVPAERLVERIEDQAEDLAEPARNELRRRPTENPP